MAQRVPVLYTEKDTFIHRLDPRAKIVLLVLSFLYVFLAPDWRWMLGFLVAGAVTALLVRLPRLWVAVLLALQLPNIIGLILLPVLLDLAFSQKVTWEGSIQLGVTLALAWAGSLLFASSIFSSMRLEQLTDGLRGLRLPETLCFVVQYAFLLLYLGISDIMRIVDMMKIKGLRLDTRNPLRMLPELPKVMVPAIFTLVRRANTMSAVLRMRGYAQTTRRRPISLRPWGAAEGASLAVAAGAVAFLVAGSLEGLSPLSWE